MPSQSQSPHLAKQAGFSAFIQKLYRPRFAFYITLGFEL